VSKLAFSPQNHGFSPREPIFDTPHALVSNLADWSGFLLARLRREIEATGDPELEAFYEELVAYPGVAKEEDRADVPEPNEIMLRHELHLDDTDLALFRTFTTFGTARDLTLAELTIVAFYPANAQTAEALAAAVGEARHD
jgi:MmyB-like transcription regulator ligand binding domain